MSDTTSAGTHWCNICQRMVHWSEVGHGHGQSEIDLRAELAQARADWGDAEKRLHDKYAAALVERDTIRERLDCAERVASARLKEIDRLTARVGQLEAALVFYANAANYIGHWPMIYENKIMGIHAIKVSGGVFDDNGEKAREALAAAGGAEVKK